MPSNKREAINRVPTNHRLAERELIILVDEGILDIDDNGRIFRNKIRKGKKSGGSHLVNIKRKRAENKVGTGYLQIRATPTPGGKRIYALAHRLVWHHFFGFIPEGMCINHKNGVKNDNRPVNLEICTYSENMKHAFKNGFISQGGEDNNNSKVSNMDVEKIREMYSTRAYYQHEIAKIFNISHQTVSKIVRGDRRKNECGPTNISNRQKNMPRNNKGQFIKVKPISNDLMIREFPK